MASSTAAAAATTTAAAAEAAAAITTAAAGKQPSAAEPLSELLQRLQQWFSVMPSHVHNSHRAATADTEGRPPRVDRCVMCEKLCSPAFTLPCHHVCTHCLDLLVCYRDRAEVVQCVQCFRLYPMTSRWRERFSVKSTVRNDEVYSSMLRRCHRCKLRRVPAPDLPHAEYFCYQCQQPLCGHCHRRRHLASPHRRRHHVVIPLVPSDWFSLLRQRMTRCSTHRRQSLSVFCLRCRLSVCALCRELSHADHPVWTFRTSLENARNALFRRFLLTLEQRALMMRLLDLLHFLWDPSPAPEPGLRHLQDCRESDVCSSSSRGCAGKERGWHAETESPGQRVKGRAAPKKRKPSGSASTDPERQDPPGPSWGQDDPLPQRQKKLKKRKAKKPAKTTREETRKDDRPLDSHSFDFGDFLAGLSGEPASSIMECDSPGDFLAGLSGEPASSIMECDSPACPDFPSGFAAPRDGPEVEGGCSASHQTTRQLEDELFHSEVARPEVTQTEVARPEVTQTPPDRTRSEFGQTEPDSASSELIETDPDRTPSEGAPPRSEDDWQKSDSSESPSLTRTDADSVPSPGESRSAVVPNASPPDVASRLSESEPPDVAAALCVPSPDAASTDDASLHTTRPCVGLPGCVESALADVSLGVTSSAPVSSAVTNTTGSSASVSRCSSDIPLDAKTSHSPSSPLCLSINTAPSNIAQQHSASPHTELSDHAPSERVPSGAESLEVESPTFGLSDMAQPVVTPLSTSPDAASSDSASANPASSDVLSSRTALSHRATSDAVSSVITSPKSSTQTPSSTLVSTECAFPETGSSDSWPSSSGSESSDVDPSHCASSDVTSSDAASSQSALPGTRPWKLTVDMAQAESDHQRFSIDMAQAESDHQRFSIDMAQAESDPRCFPRQVGATSSWAVSDHWPQVQSPQEQSPRVQSPRVQSPRVQSPRVQSPQEQSPQEQSPQEPVARPSSPAEAYVGRSHNCQAADLSKRHDSCKVGPDGCLFLPEPCGLKLPKTSAVGTRMDALDSITPESSDTETSVRSSASTSGNERQLLREHTWDMDSIHHANHADSKEGMSPDTFPTGSTSRQPPSHAEPTDNESQEQTMNSQKGEVRESPDGHPRSLAADTILKRAGEDGELEPMVSTVFGKSLCQHMWTAQTLYNILDARTADLGYDLYNHGLSCLTSVYTWMNARPAISKEMHAVLKEMFPDDSSSDAAASTRTSNVSNDTRDWITQSDEISHESGDTIASDLSLAPEDVSCVWADVRPYRRHSAADDTPPAEAGHVVCAEEKRGSNIRSSVISAQEQGEVQDRER